jgi:PKD repeat protein
MVKKETRFSEIGNPTNFCITTDSLLIDASLSVSTQISCWPQFNLKVYWLTGTTVGIASYYSGCTYVLKEIGVNYGSGASISTAGPMSSLYSTSQNFFTYNLPSNDSDYTFTQHIILPVINTVGGLIGVDRFLSADSMQTPTDCHASFFLTPADATLNNWTVQNYSSGADSLSYFWDFGDGTTSTLTSPSHTYATTGTYTVCLTVNSGTCSDTYCQTAFTDSTQVGYGMKTLTAKNMAVGIKENKATGIKIILFPNPATNELNVTMEKGINEDYTIFITDVLGREQQIQTASISSQACKLNISSLPSGLYVIHLKTKSGNTLAKERFIKN